MAIGEIVESGCSFESGQIRLKLRSEVTAETIFDGVAVATAADPVEFAYIDTRTVRTGSIRGYKFGQGSLDEQYLSADPDAPTWHEVLPNMKQYFSDDGTTRAWFTREPLT